MLIQPLLDKLLQLRLPAFRDGLQEQLNNPKYAELTFEERLALLVDQECSSRHQRRIQRRVKQAGFPQPACVEDLDLSASRGLDWRFILELAQGTWCGKIKQAIFSPRFLQNRPSQPVSFQGTRMDKCLSGNWRAPKEWIFGIFTPVIDN